MNLSTRRIAALLGLTAGMAFGATALAQQGGFTLFGEATPKISGDDAFVHPVTSPYWHEDSFITTDVRAWYISHRFNDEVGPLRNGQVTGLAVQLRLALTDNLQFVAYKDGYLDFGSPFSQTGWNDVAAGIKWQWLRLDNERLYSAVGAGYEIPIGDPGVLQNDAEVRLWGSVNKGFGKLHLGATVNYRLSTTDENKDAGNSDVLSWHVHADYRVTEIFSPIIEFNGFHIVNEGGGLAVNGADVTNLGGGDDDTITGAIGCELRAGENTAIRGAYEIPLNGSDDLFGTRFTFSLVYSF
jgi:hypothetical protein